MSVEMSLQLDKSMVGERLQGFPMNNYLFLGGVIKGVALATGAIALLSILEQPNLYWPRIGPWFGAFAGLLLTHVTWGRGVLLTNSRANLGDHVFPLLMGFTEIALFAALIPHGVEEPQIELWRHWALIFAIHTFFAVLLVENRRKNTFIEEDFELPLQQLAGEYEGWLKRDRLGAAVTSLVSAVAWALMTFSPWLNSDAIYFAFGLLAGVFLLIGPVREAEEQRRRIEEFLSKK